MRRTIRFLRKGETVEVEQFAPRTTLLDWLRLSERSTGTKEGCGEGDCGACTVVLRRLVDGRLVPAPVNACILLLGQVDGSEVLTVEDLAAEGRLHPVQQAMVEHHGSQCGFCTPGIVMSLFALYEAGMAPDRQEVTDALAGNLCRCTGYTKIYQAIEKAAEALRADAMPVGVSAGGGSARGARNVGGASAQDAFDRRHPADPPDSPEEIVAASRSDGRDACAAGNADRNV